MSQRSGSTTARDRIVALLEQRARVLAPSPALVEQALQRCLGQVARESEVADEIVAAGVPDHLQVESSGSSGSPAAVAASPGEVDLQAPTAPGSRIERDAEVFARNRSRNRKQVLAPGQEIAGYRIESLIGKGGMGQVYKALQLSMNRHVAFKVLAPRLARDENFRSRFLREARNAGKLQHPNLIGVHDVGEADSLLFFSMELVDGRSVREILRDEGPFAEDRAREICGQVLEALKFAHANGLVHRDIKPDNVMITAAGVVKVGDLGLSRGVGREEDSRGTRTGAFMGTPYYMPPEQGRDARNVDHRADIYAVGATLYHMVCGRVPFSGRTPMDVLIRASTQPLTFPDDGPSAAVRRVIGRLMARDPDGRPASAEEAQVLVLGKRLTLQNSGRIFGERSGQHLRRRRSRSMLPLTLVLVVLAALGAVIAVAVAGHRGKARWQDLRDEVQQLIERDAFAAAHDVLDAHLRQHPEVGERVTGLRERVTAAWDDHVRSAAQPLFEQIEALRREGEYAQARTVLARARSELQPISPSVQAELDSLAERLASESTLAWVSGIDFTPATRARSVGPGTYRLEGFGRGRLPVARSMSAGAVIDLRFELSGTGHITFRPPGENPAREIVIDRSETRVRARAGANGMAVIAARSHRGPARLSLIRRGDGAITLMLAGHPDNALLLPADDLRTGFAFTWKLDDSSAILAFGEGEPAPR